MEAKPFLAGALLGATAGAVVGAVLARPPAATPRAPARTAPLERRMEAVEDALDRLARALRDRPGAEAGAPDARGAAEPGTAPAAADADALSPDPSAAGPAADPPASNPHWAGLRTEIQKLAGRPANREALAQIGHDHAERLLKYNSAAPALARRHLFLTYTQILKRYGRPDSVAVTQQGAVFRYKLAVPNAESQYHLSFTFVDGMVLRTGAMSSRFRRR